MALRAELVNVTLSIRDKTFAFHPSNLVCIYQEYMSEYSFQASHEKMVPQILPQILR